MSEAEGPVARPAIAGDAPGPGPLHRPRRRARVALVHLLAALVGGAVGVTLPLLHVAPMLAAGRVGGMLATLGFGLISLISVIFSLLYLVAQWAFANLTPRLSSFIDDPLVWRTFGLAIGLFVYCVLAALAVADSDKVTFLVPVVALLGVLAVLALIRNVQFAAFSSIQLMPTLARIAGEGRAALDRLYPERFPGDEAAPAAPAGPPSSTVLWPHQAAYVQQIDLAGLVDAARAAGSLIVLRPAVGSVVHPGAPVADCFGGAVSDDAVLPAVVGGHYRTFAQDPVLPFRLLADICLRALSPAVNDPATARQALEAGADLLRLVAGRNLAVGAVADGDGAPRVIFAVPGWADYVRTWADDVIEAAAHSPMVLQEAVVQLRELAQSVPQVRRVQLHARLDRARQLLLDGFPHLAAVAAAGDARP